MDEIISGFGKIADDINEQPNRASEILTSYFDDTLIQIWPVQGKGKMSSKRYLKFLLTKDLYSYIMKRSETRSYSTAYTMQRMYLASQSEVLPYDSIPSFDDIINAYEEMNIISVKGSHYFNSVVDLVRKNYQGLISDGEFEKSICSLIELFDDDEFKIDSTEGMYIASILSIAHSSIEWWKENPDELEVDGKIAPWVTADVGGAVCSGLFGLITTGNTSLTNVGYGAVMASTGAAKVVGNGIVKAVKWIIGL